MREVLFRGQRIRQKLTDKGEWVYGAFIPDPKEALEGHVCGAGFIWQWDPETRHRKVSVVSRETVGQWTGLTDRNGVRIFEGDIVTLDLAASGNAVNCDAIVAGPEENLTVQPMLVQWNADWACFNACAPNCEPDTLDAAEWVVVGNIYDNPELLEAEI